MRRKILFVTGTRADYGKIKPLIKAVEDSETLEAHVFVCGMHLLEKYGSTYCEVLKDGYKHTYIAFGLNQTQDMSTNLGNTICCLSSYVEHVMPDMIVVHGDRMDALAGAVVGALKNIIVSHIEGGEVSGTIDESTRHAISKFAHIHFVCTNEAKQRLMQMGENEKRIYVIGSPDIDIMLSDKLPNLETAKEKYNIDFDSYAILMYHPVTTEIDEIGKKVSVITKAIANSNTNYIVVYPNNDLGSEVILNQYKIFEGNEQFRIFPSLRFEYFLTLLKNAEFIIGNSSAGIRESGIYGVPAIDIGTRQANRYSLDIVKNVQHVSEDEDEIRKAISSVSSYATEGKHYGEGKSTEKFMKIISEDEFWSIQLQKKFIDLTM